MTEIALICLSLVAIISVLGLVYLFNKQLGESKKERELLVKLVKAKDVQEFEYVMVDDKPNTEEGAFDENNPNIVDLENIVLDKEGK